ncbi:hypothetical protein KSD_27140 [Ktedonobacter sp. SOSP1-85]|uniref:hypothetical protein n=1 Tax=Ktedonobacter sp. SOSP1-85 TaxID=2778367 RepID=UPI001915B734|nr:hypothetical protein [Ktedonobacter sp. SOSP1-85]GHO74943.1 hypothetical protein KSD_27140 [Ktedonobacter sp. SOSP1-85]
MAYLPSLQRQAHEIVEPITPRSHICHWQAREQRERKNGFRKSLAKGVDKPQAVCDTTGAVDERTKTAKTLQEFETPDTQAQAHGLAGLRFKQKKNEPEHPEQLKSGMQKYNGTSLIEHRSIVKNTVPVNSANKAMK